VLASGCYLCTPLTDLPYFSSQPRKMTICSRHIMASLRDIKIAEEFLKCAPHILICESHNASISAISNLFYEYILRIFRSGWMDCRDAFHAVLCLLLYNGQNITEYEAYWFMGFPIINLWGVHFTSTFSISYSMVVLYIGIMKVWGFWPKIITPKPT